MTLLSVLLSAKILVTLVFVAGPFLLLPAERLNAAMAPHSGSAMMYRLYGVALLALVTAYAGGLVAAQSGRLPVEVIAMGLVSNFGGALTQAVFRVTGPQRVLMGFFAFVGLGLLVAAFNPSFALTRVW